MKKHRLFFVSVLISIFLVFTLHLFGFRINDYLLGYDQYYDYYSALSAKGSSFQQWVSGGFLYPLDYLIGQTGNPILSMRLLPFLMIVPNMLLIVLLAYYMIKDEMHRTFTVLLLSAAPATIFTHGTYNMVVFPLFFILLGSLLIIKDKYFLAMLSFLVSLVLNASLFLAVILVLIILYERFKSRNILVPLILLGGATYMFYTFNKPSFSLGSAGMLGLFKLYFSDFGSDIGLGIFEVILAAIGLIISWKNKRDHAIIYMSIVSLGFASYASNTLILFLEIILAYYAGYALSSLWHSSWESNLLKNYVLLLALCGILFSAGAYINRFSKSGPYFNEIISLEWLRDHPDDGNTVLSYYEYGSLINSISNLPTYTDKRYYIYSNRAKIDESNMIFQSRDLATIKEFFDRNSIRYIWINRAMKQGQVWDKEDQGLLFVLKNSANFKNIYNYMGIEIWWYTPAQINTAASPAVSSSSSIS